MNGNDAITVGELIQHLQTFDPGLPVFYSCCSAWTPLQSDEVTEHTMADQRGYAELASRAYVASDRPRFKALLFPGN